jgi:hypothetical protein
MTSLSLAQSFRKLFAGLDTAYGIYDLSAARVDENGKRTGRAVTKRGAVTDELWDLHLSGKEGLGIIPIRATNDAVFGAIDVDVYSGLQHQGLVAKLARFGIPMTVCRTKSGGAHLYLFSKVPVPAVVVRAKLSEIATLMGFGDCEIFPKQNAISAEECGNWINIPYFGGTRGMRYAVDLSGNALSPEQFLELAATSAVDEAWFDKKIVIVGDFSDGPPCLQALAQAGYPPGTRNNGLYAIGVYLKQAQPDTWQNDLDICNHKYMQPPLLMSEVQGTIKSLGKKDYHYQCQQQPLLAHCNSVVCRTRKFGVGNNGTAGRFPTLGGLIKLETDPPVWFWSLEGKKVTLTTQELQDPAAFQRACINSINMMPAMPSKPVWTAAVQRALETLTIVEAPPDASAEGLFWEHVERFCTGRSQALNLGEITLGKPFTKDGRTYFRMNDLLDYLTRRKFMEYKAPKIAALLNEVGAQHHFSIISGHGTNYWSLVEFAKSKEPLEVPKNIGETENAF